MRHAGFRQFLLVFVLIAGAPAGAGASLRSDLFEVQRPQPMRFDHELGVHTLPGRAGVYYFDHAFLRIHEGTWQFSRSAQGPWLERPIEWVPLKLRLKHYAEER